MMMTFLNSKAIKISLALLCVMCTQDALFAAPKSIELPPDSAQLKVSTLPGYQKALANCVYCHSAEYMIYQPASASRGYWDNMVKRMKNVFNAPVKEEDMSEIVDYLVKTYGSEKPR
jgi:sulfite dehydrogenase (cytochrome) subunit B